MLMPERLEESGVLYLCDLKFIKQGKYFTGIYTWHLKKPGAAHMA
jgi:hypothetical protein